MQVEGSQRPGGPDGPFGPGAPGTPGLPASPSTPFLPSLPMPGAPVAPEVEMDRCGMEMNMCLLGVTRICKRCFHSKLDVDGGTVT